jgi:decaprenylphospho-beta-D-ribofuranose 2-oxidase
MTKNIFSNWTKNVFYNKKILYPKNLNELKKIININKDSLGICGNLRSFNDSCINKDKLISLKKFKKEIILDKKNSTLFVSSNILLIEVLKKIVPEGFMISVTPGSKYVTIGGMISSNVIGKNSKNNQFKYLIEELKILTPKNKVIKCSNKTNKKNFDLVVGGFGLAGTVLSAKIKLKKIKNQYVDVKTIKFNDYDEFNKIPLNKNRFNVAWIDSHSLNSKKFKGLFSIGDYNLIKNKNEKFECDDKEMNFITKSFLIFYINNFFFSKIINFLYLNLFLKNKTVNFNTAFYPQDKWLNFNQCYNNGFFQVQILIPEKNFKLIMNTISIFFNQNKLKSTFIILKKINENGKYLDFFGKGYSVSFDIPKDEKYLKTRSFFNNLILNNNLKPNLSKDTLLNSKFFKKNNHYKNFIKKLHSVDNKKIYTNEFSKRLKIK